MELPRQVGTLGSRGHPLTNICHIGFEFGILVEADRSRDVLGGLLAHLDFLRFRDQGELALAGNGVAGAAEESGSDAGAEEERAPPSQRDKTKARSHRASWVFVLSPDLIMSSRLMRRASAHINPLD